MKEENYTPQNLLNNNSFNIREELEKYIIHWKWFALTSLITLLLAFFSLRYSTSEYKTSTTILIKDDNKGGLSDELAAFKDLGGIGAGSGKNIQDEIQIIKSRQLMNDVVNKLNLNIKYIVEGRLKESEIYQNKAISLFLNDSTSTNLNTVITLETLSSNNFRILNANAEVISEGLFDQPKTNSVLGNFIIKKTSSFNKNIIGSSIKVIITPINQVISSYQGRISVEPISRYSNILKLSLQSPLKKKSEDILNELVSQYNKDAIKDKKEISEKTSSFIIDRLKNVGFDLSKIDNKVESFKNKNNITDIQSEAEITLKTNTENHQNLAKITTELNLTKALAKELDKYDYLPTNLGLFNDNISASIVKYNNLLSKLNRIEKSAGSKNTVLIELNQNIKDIKTSLKLSLNNSIKSLQFRVNGLQNQANKYSARISSIPTKEREYLDIARQQEIIATLYSYLLNKKEETAISLAASTIPNAKTIDKAYSATINSKKEITYLSAFLLGLLIPFIIIYLKDLLDTKVHSKKDIQDFTTIPFLGDIPHSTTKEKIVINASARSSTAEAFRLIRTNLNFMLPEVKDKKGKTIFITSTTSGEGKSFTSINLASSLSLSGKKVILVGMDLRAPKITEYLEIPNRKGITNFITDDNILLNSLKFNIDEIPNLDIIASGAIPPNPAELLMTNKVSEIFNELQTNYDYVIIDTAPVNLVTDTLLISKHADIVLYVTRANYLDKRMLSVPQSLYLDKKLPNLAIILNDTDLNRGYGYGYGYGYIDQDEKPWYNRLFTSN